MFIKGIIPYSSLSIRQIGRLRKKKEKENYLLLVPDKFKKSVLDTR